jgi:hypothetical protein
MSSAQKHDEPQHRPVVVVIRDSQTGESRSVDGWTPWHWACGNGACDCNRSMAFGREDECSESRYYIIEVIGDESGYELNEDYNSGYPAHPELKRAANKGGGEHERYE